MTFHDRRFLQYIEPVTQTCSLRKVFLEILQNSHKSTCARVSISIKFILIKFYKFIKIETLAKVISCEFYEISKNTFSYSTPLAAASEYIYRSFIRPHLDYGDIISDEVFD